eukprot:1159745-Pelagomonas_calceolata.AAC.8
MPVDVCALPRVPCSQGRAKLRRSTQTSPYGAPTNVCALPRSPCSQGRAKLWRITQTFPYKRTILNLQMCVLCLAVLAHRGEPSCGEAHGGGPQRTGCVPG